MASKLNPGIGGDVTPAELSHYARTRHINVLGDTAPEQALQIVLYMLRQSGWTIDLSHADNNGARIAAHKDAPKTRYSLSPNLRDLEE